MSRIFGSLAPSPSICAYAARASRTYRARRVHRRRAAHYGRRLSRKSENRAAIQGALPTAPGMDDEGIPERRPHRSDVGRNRAENTTSNRPIRADGARGSLEKYVLPASCHHDHPIMVIATDGGGGGHVEIHAPRIASCLQRWSRVSRVRHFARETSTWPTGRRPRRAIIINATVS